jgi:hypothetical protein
MEFPVPRRHWCWLVQTSQQLTNKFSKVLTSEYGVWQSQSLDLGVRTYEDENKSVDERNGIRLIRRSTSQRCKNRLLVLSAVLRT